MRIDTSLLVGLVLAALTASMAHAQEVGASVSEPLVVFLVRHANRADGNADSALSPDGHERAAALADTLRDARIEYVHSTDFVRTRSTATPTAAEFELPIRSYDPSDLPSLVASIQTLGGRHLVVGHSDTTPLLVELFGGDPGSAIDAGEFDRLYVIAIGGSSKTSSVMLRYGEPYTPP